MQGKTRMISANICSCGKEMLLEIYCKNSFSNRAFYVKIIADIRSLKLLRTLLDNYLDHMLVKLEQNRLVWNMQIFHFFWQKMVNHFWERKCWRHFETLFCDINNYLMLKY